MFIFKYDNKIDDDNWERILNNGVGFDKRTLDDLKNFKRDIALCAKMVPEFESVWRVYENKFLQKIGVIYSEQMPSKMHCYINSSPYSYFNINDNFISISAHTKKNRIIPSMLHEINHWFFKKFYTDYCITLGYASQDIDLLKEILTAINDDVFWPMQDGYWEGDERYRFYALEIWKNTKDIKSVVKSMKQYYG